jgi:transposase-like protein
MGRPKGGKNRNRSKEEKLRVVLRNLDDKIGQRTIAREENISRGQVHSWIQKYLEGGPDALENRKKPGNPFAALSTSKSLTEEQRLKLIVEKQKIEIERLKKGYVVKGVGASKEFVTLRDLNTK